MAGDGETVGGGVREIGFRVPGSGFRVKKCNHEEREDHEEFLTG